MLVLSGFCQVETVNHEESKGSYFKFTLNVGSRNVVNCHLWLSYMHDKPQENGIYFFAAVQEVGIMKVHSFTALDEGVCKRLPHTRVTLTGKMTDVKDDSIVVQYGAYNPVTKKQELREGKVEISGDYLKGRGKVLKAGRNVEVVGTLEEGMVVDMDDFGLCGKEDDGDEAKVKKEKLGLFEM